MANCNCGVENKEELSVTEFETGERHLFMPNWLLREEDRKGERGYHEIRSIDGALVEYV